ncbi:hypothetical protein [Actinomadura madurae]|uniref:hypothetical protein n=1 Tax=Actinomadura madurae TaxID=1993 RepID=UPI0011BE00B2|nr:hypothetical protein [Actinomadura madurae]
MREADRMDEAQAIALVVKRIRSRNLDYPTDGLVADRYEGGWCVYASVDVDESDPVAFLEMPVGRLVFLVGETGLVEEVSSSDPPPNAQERVPRPPRAGLNADEYMEEFAQWLAEDGPDDRRAVDDFAIVGRGDRDHENEVGVEAAQRIEPIVQQLALLGPHGWQWLWADFAFTVSAEISHLRFSSHQGSVVVPVPESVAELVRDQRDAAAHMPAGPWWRLMLTVTDHGETTVNYDYGDGPFPHDRLLAPEHYGNDLDTYPRPYVAAWLARYIEGPDAY